jgi:hypothetical protein
MSAPMSPGTRPAGRGTRRSRVLTAVPQPGTSSRVASAVVAAARGIPARRWLLRPSPRHRPSPPRPASPGAGRRPRMVSRRPAASSHRSRSVRSRLASSRARRSRSARSRSARLRSRSSRPRRSRSRPRSRPLRLRPRNSRACSSHPPRCRSRTRYRQRMRKVRILVPRSPVTLQRSGWKRYSPASRECLRIWRPGCCRAARCQSISCCMMKSGTRCGADSGMRWNERAVRPAQCGVRS